MDKEKEIEEMVSFLEMQLPVEYEIVEYYDDNYTEVRIKSEETATNFVEAGYSNVKQAIEDFAEKFHKRCNEQLMSLEWEYGQGARDVLNIFNELTKELCEEE